MENPVTEVTLFFGIGATKAGTSWLHSQLQAHPECHLRTIKELHYFSLTNPRQVDRALKTAQSDAATAAQKARGAMPDKRAYAEARAYDLAAWCEVLQAGSAAHDRYLGYLLSGRGRRHLVGDVTPGYSLLPDDTLTMMSRLTPDVRFIYLMRDPVDRLWSHVRMVCARADRTNFASASLTLMRAILDGQNSAEITGILNRGDYAAILAKLARAIPAKQRLDLFYEDMVAPGGLTPVCNFLGIAPSVAAGQTRVHAGLPLPLPSDLLIRARRLLQPQYDAAQASLGTLPRTWAANLT